MKKFLVFLGAVLSFFILQGLYSLKQYAAGEQAELYFASVDDTRIDTAQSIRLPQGPNTLKLMINSRSYRINGFDIAISLQNSRNFSLVEGSHGKLFNLLFANKADLNNNTIRFSKFATEGSQPPITGVLNLALITFTPSDSKGTIGIQKAKITSPGVDVPLTVSKPQLSYIIQAPTPTLEPTITTPVLIPSPTPMPTATTSLEAAPTIVLTSTPTLYPETPTPTPRSQKTIDSITINGKPVDINNPVLDIHLPGKEGEADAFVVPFIITYSDGSTTTIYLSFDYQPILPTPTLTSVPVVSSPVPSVAVSSCDKIDNYTTCRESGCIWEVLAPEFGIGAGKCKPQPSPTQSSILRKNTWFCELPPVEYAACENSSNILTQECCYQGRASCIRPDQVCGAPIPTPTNILPTPTRIPTPTPLPTPIPKYKIE